MDGASIFKFSIMDVPKLFKKYFEFFDYTEKSFDMIFLHQANLFIMKNIIRKLKMSPDKMAVSLDRYGNTGAATIPLTICDYYCNKEKMESHNNQHIIMSGYGIGLSLGIVSLTFDPDVCLPIFESDLSFDDDIESLHQKSKSKSFINS
jgi:3-oxoacyl-[acyl-carrier-protein] synthase-3